MPFYFFSKCILESLGYFLKFHDGLSVCSTRGVEQPLQVQFPRSRRLRPWLLRCLSSQVESFFYNLTVECALSTCCHQFEHSLAFFLCKSGNQSSETIPDTQVRSHYQGYNTTPLLVADSQSEFLAKVISSGLLVKHIRFFTILVQQLWTLIYYTFEI